MMGADASDQADRFVSDVIARIGAPHNDAETGQQLAHWLATWLWKNTTGIYRLDVLETTLMRKLALESPGHLPISCADREEVHLATEVYAFGGHTALMRHLMQEAPTPPDVILTGMSDATAAGIRLNVPESRVSVLPPSTDLRAQVMDLAGRLSPYRRVVLHIHPNDLVSALAIRVLRMQAPSVHVQLVNHADHAFSVAIGSAHRILEISRYGWALRGKRGSLQTSSFIGIPITSTGARPPFPHPIKAAQFLTGGSSYKFRPINGMSLPAAFARLLQRHRNHRVTAIGPKRGDWWWWPLLARYPGRVKISRLVPKETYQQLVGECTVYVDSHPLLGGTALPEALMRGGLVAGMRGLAWGYSPSDELISDSVDAFILQCEELANANPMHLATQRVVRDRCIQFHAPDAVRRRMESSASGHLVVPPDTTAPMPDPTSMERSWSAANASHLPSRKECPLSKADRWWLLAAHAKLRGWRHRGTWTLLRHALKG